MELSVKINAAIDGFISAMKAAKDSVAGVTNAAAKPIALNTDTISLDEAKTKVSELRSELGKLTQAGQGGSPAAAEIRAQIKALNAEVKEAEQGMKKLGGGGALDGLKKSFAEVESKQVQGVEFSVVSQVRRGRYSVRSERQRRQ